MGEKLGSQLLIGLDAMEWNLVRRWVQEGKLPVLSHLIETGAHAVLSSPAAQFPDTVWPSLYTGTNPAKQERYFFVQYDAGSQALRRVSDDVLHGIPFWTYLSRAGHRLAVVDVPKFPLIRDLNGTQLTNWGAHATRTARSSLPGTLLDEIRSRFGEFPVQECDAVDMTPAALTRLRQRVLDGVRLHGELFRWMMKRTPWDEFLAAFSAPHCIGHHLWHGLETAHPQYEEARQHGLSQAIEDVYRAIDREIGAMLEAAGRGTRVMVMAAHGMAPLCHGSWNLQEILDLLGHGHPDWNGMPSGTQRKGTRNFFRTLRVAMPGPMQFKIAELLPQAFQNRLLFGLNAGRRRWKHCRAFAVPNNDSVGAIRINLKGRDRHGIVEPGEDYWQLCKQIVADLEELVDPVSGKSVVSRVTVTHEQFHGPFLDQLPDITVLWNQSFRWSSVHSSSFGSLAIPAQDRRTGSHSPDGFVIVAGPGVPAGLELKGHSIYDIAPTVLAAAGVPIPSNMDGCPLPV